MKSRFVTFVSVAALTCIALLVGFLVALLGTANSARAGDEFVVSAPTVPSSYPNYPHAALLTGGDVVVVWRQYGDVSGGVFRGQRISPTGEKSGAESPVAAVHDAGADLSVAALADGGFAVVWIDIWGPKPTIRGQRFSATGDKVGSMFVVVEPSRRFLGSVRIAAHANGGFLVTWTRERPAYDSDVMAQRFTADAVKAGEPIMVNDAPGNNISANVAPLGNGWIVIWSSANGVFAQRLNSIRAEARSTIPDQYDQEQIHGAVCGAVAGWRICRRMVRPEELVCATPQPRGTKAGT